MLEGHRDLPPRIIPADSMPAPLPVRMPQQAREELDTKHELEQRAPDLFHVDDAPQTWRHLHRVLTREGPET